MRATSQSSASELLEERQPAQRLEAVGVGELLALARTEVLGAERGREIGGEVGPVRVALREVLGHRALHDDVDRLGNLGAKRRRRLGFGVGDLVDQRVIVRCLERQPSSEQVVHHHAFTCSGDM